MLFRAGYAGEETHAAAVIAGWKGTPRTSVGFEVDGMRQMKADGNFAKIEEDFWTNSGAYN